MNPPHDKAAVPSEHLPQPVQRQLCSELSRVNGQANEMLLRFIGHGIVEAERYLKLAEKPREDAD